MHVDRTFILRYAIRQGRYWLWNVQRWSVDDMAKGLHSIINTLTREGSVGPPAWVPRALHRQWLGTISDGTQCCGEYRFFIRNLRSSVRLFGLLLYRGSFTIPGSFFPFEDMTFWGSNLNQSSWASIRLGNGLSRLFPRWITEFSPSILSFWYIFLRADIRIKSV